MVARADEPDEVIMARALQIMHATLLRRDEELALLPFSVKLLTYECGIRFLTDYLNGDTYFKIHREHHNLDRARNQFKLVADLENMEEELLKYCVR